MKRYLIILTMNILLLLAINLTLDLWDDFFTGVIINYIVLYFFNITLSISALWYITRKNRLDPDYNKRLNTIIEIYKSSKNSLK